MILISLHMLQLCQPLAPRCCFTVSPILLAALDRANRDCATAKPAPHRYNSISASKKLCSACGSRCRSEGYV